MNDVDYNIRALENGDSLTDFDKEVINIIKKGCSSFPEKKITARIAGGWVRDHILGNNSDDIDVIIDSVTCNEFGERILSFDDNYSIVHLSSNKPDGKAISFVRIGISYDTWIDITDYGDNGNPVDDAK